MPIVVRCSCGKSLRAPDSLAGKAARCPACKSPLRIPADSSGEPAAPIAAPIVPYTVETIKAAKRTTEQVKEVIR